MVKDIDTGTSDETGATVRRLQVDIEHGSATMQRVADGTHQLLMVCVPVDDATFDAVLAAVKARGASGALAEHLRDAELDTALEELAGRS